MLELAAWGRVMWEHKGLARGQAITAKVITPEGKGCTAHSCN